MATKQVVKSAINYHNQKQLDYFGEKVKGTMIPVESPYVLKHVREFIRFGAIDHRENILEVGCGMGKFTFPLLKSGFKITGLDLSPFLLQKLLEYNDNRYKIPLICSDILEIPGEYDQVFDKVVGFFTLHHFHHLETYFQAMSRALKPGGEIVFVEPNAYNPLYYLQIAFTPGMSWKGDKGVAMMTKKNFKKAAAYADLKLIDTFNYGFFPPFIVNTAWGEKLDSITEKLSLINPILPFQLIRLKKQ